MRAVGAGRSLRSTRGSGGRVNALTSGRSRPGRSPSCRWKPATALAEVGRHQRDDQAVGAGAGGAAGTVRVVLEVGRRVEVHDARDAVDVDAARGDVGGHEGLHLAVGERGQRPLALTLRAVAVDGRAPHAALLELLRQRVGAVLGAAEHDGRAGHADDLGSDVHTRRRGRPPRSGASPRADRSREAGDATGRAGTGAPARRRRRRAWPRTAASGACSACGRAGRCTAGRKPMSAMRSASSTTTISTSSRSTSRRSMRSVRRPGQATSTSTPRRSALNCAPKPAPP